MTDAEQLAALDRWLKAHPIAPLTDWEKKTLDGAREVDPPEAEEPDDDLSDARAAAVYGVGW